MEPEPFTFPYIEKEDECYSQFADSHPFLEIDFSYPVRYSQLIPGKSYIAMYKHTMYGWSLTRKDKINYTIRQVVFKEKRLENERYRLFLSNKYRYEFCDVNGGDFTHPCYYLNGQIFHNPCLLNEFEFNQEIIKIYDFSEGFAPCK